MAWTNKGKAFLLGLMRGEVLPTNFYIALATDAVPPTADTNVLADVTEISDTNGYVEGGFELDPNSTDFDTLTEDDANDRGAILIKDVSWTAAGGPIPSAGAGARYAVLTDDNAVIADREVYFYWDLLADRSVSDTQSITLQNLEIRITEPV